MLRFNLSMSDDYLLPALKEEARRQGLTTSELIEQFCIEGLERKHPRTITVYYTDGSTMTEHEFVSARDLYDSVRAYRQLIGKPVASGEKVVKGYTVHDNGFLAETGGKIDDGKEL